MAENFRSDLQFPTPWSWPPLCLKTPMRFSQILCFGPGLVNFSIIRPKSGDWMPPNQGAFECETVKLRPTDCSQFFTLGALSIVALPWTHTFIIIDLWSLRFGICSEIHSKSGLSLPENEDNWQPYKKIVHHFVEIGHLTGIEICPAKVCSRSFLHKSKCRIHSFRVRLLQRWGCL